MGPNALPAPTEALDVCWNIPLIRHSLCQYSWRVVWRRRAPHLVTVGETGRNDITGGGGTTPMDRRMRSSKRAE